MSCTCTSPTSAIVVSLQGLVRRMLHRPIRDSVTMSPIAREVIELHELVDDLALPTSLYALWDATLEVAFDQQRLELLQRLAHRIGLAQDVDAVLILFDHLADPPNVALDVIEALENVLFVRHHGLALFFVTTPSQGVWV